MIVKSSRETNTYRFTTESGHTSSVINYFGTEPTMDKSLPRPQHDALYPVSFVVSLEPDYVLDPHFHLANQFQLFIDGDGTLGKEQLTTYSVHYASAYTPYGPMVAGERGLRYMTLRNGWDGGPRYLPKHNEALRAAGRPRRYLPVAPIRLDDPAPVSDIFPTEADGLGGWVYRVAGGGSATGCDPRTGGGQIWVVAAGTVSHGGKDLPHLSCVFVNPDDPPLTLSATSEAAVIMLQFPRWPEQAPPPH